jgi:hypothetical protein
MDYPWGTGTQTYAGVTTNSGQPVTAASGPLVVTGSGTSLTNVNYCNVDATAKSYNTQTKKLTFNVLLPTGRNGSNQPWPFQGTFDGTVNPATITGTGTQPSQTGVGDDVDPWMATAN